MAPSFVRYSSYRSHDHYQRQRVLQKERAIVSRGTGHGRRELAPDPCAHRAVCGSGSGSWLCGFSLTLHRKREEWYSLGRYLAE